MRQAQLPVLHTSSRVRHAVFVAWLVLTCATARADSWGSPQDLAATSPSGKVGVRIRPDPTGVSITVTRAGAEKTWRGVNPEAPVLAFVCDGGAVVTLNEWAHVGYEHALVLYAPDGRVLADRGLDELLTPDELDTKVKHSVSSRWWLADDQPARCDGARFLAPTRWGTTIVVTLADGALARAIPTARERLDAQARGKRPFQGVTFRIETARHTADDVGGVICDVAAPKATCTTWGKTLAQPSERARSAEASFEKHFVKPVAVDQLLAALDAQPTAA